MYKLNKPYSDISKTEFIFKYNHDCDNNGYNCRIEETNTALYALEENEILVNDEVVIDPEWDSKYLAKAKEAKIAENDNLRDTALNQGVTYKNVLFDSDTDQKVNLLATVSDMGDTEHIVWFGMDNQPLDCTKQDLFNIGGLITQLHSFCWEKNYQIKTAIQEAETVEQVEAIEIDYNGGI